MEILKKISEVLWGPPLLVLLVGTHLFLTFRLGFIQRFLGKGIRLSVQGGSIHDGVEGDVSPFGALTTALAATIGTGNIVGVATAITLGGPGAVFWCWIAGVFGIATKYGEALLAVKYRVTTADGRMLGGPMYALEKGVGSKLLAVLFCLFAALASFGIGSSTQANSIATMLQDEFKIAPVISGVILALLTLVVVVGGVKSISKVCEKLVPFMAVFYVAGCLVILFLNRDFLLPALSVIIKSAFVPQAAAGGFVGSTLMAAARFGIARGLFSNESGLGSAPIVAAAAKSPNPVHQALVSMTGTFWDTVVVCAITGLVLVSSMLRQPEVFAGLTGGGLTNMAFDRIPVVGGMILAVGLATFAFSTILGWSYYGERCVEYLLGRKAIFPYQVLYVLSVFIGSVAALSAVWTLSDIMNALMALPNLLALLLLSGVIAKETKAHIGKYQ